jgi:hypothetical protein
VPNGTLFKKIINHITKKIKSFLKKTGKKRFVFIRRVYKNRDFALKTASFEKVK